MSKEPKLNPISPSVASKKNHSKPNSFGWWVLAGAFGVLFLVQGSRSILGVAFKPIVEEFGWSRSDLSLVFLVHMTIFALMLPIVGKYYDRYGGKWIIIVSSLCLAVGYLGITAVSSLALFLICYGLLAAIGFGGCSITLFAAVASKWFQRNRGLAVSLALCGGPVGQFAMVPPATYVIHTFGWRWVFISLALLVIIVNLIVAHTLMKSPAHRAAVSVDHHRRAAGNATETAQADLGLSQAMKTRSFWLFTILMAICGGGDYLIMTHLVPMVTDKGVSPQTAGSMMAWFGLMGMAGLLVTGPLVDRFGNKLPMIGAFALRFVVFILILMNQNVTAFYIFSFVFGFTLLITAPITTTLPAKLYGLSHIGLISGVITTVHHFSGGLWAYLGGAAYDRLGSYHLIFSCYAALSILAIIFGLLIKEKKHRVDRVGWTIHQQ